MFPKNSKILIVDDDYNDVAGLMKALSRMGTSYSYFDGSDESLPIEPLENVRLIILDVDLGAKFVGGNDKIKATLLADYLSKLVSKKSRPLAILFWTRNEELVESVISSTWQAEIPTVFHACMDKPSKDEMNDYDDAKIRALGKEITSKISNDSFNFLMWWENLIQEKSAIFVNEFAAIPCIDEWWDSSIKNILTKLSCTYTGRKKILDSERSQALEYASAILNQGFAETLSKGFKCEEKFDLPQQSDTSIGVVARMNSILFVENINDNNVENGKVFFDSYETLLFESLKKKILTGEFQKKTECRNVSVILTPPCDISHDKFLKTNGGIEYHRILSGLKITISSDTEAPFSHAASAVSYKQRLEKMIELDTRITEKLNQCLLENDVPNPLGPQKQELLNVVSEEQRILKAIKKKLKDDRFVKSPEYLFVTQPFVDENNSVCIFVFHFGTVRTIPIAEGKYNFRYLLKNSLVSDLQSKLSNHVNRLGNSMLEC